MIWRIALGIVSMLVSNVEKPMRLIVRVMSGGSDEQTGLSRGR